MQRRLYRLCCDIIDVAYPTIDSNQKKIYKRFYINLVNREYKTKNGDYDMDKKQINVYSISRDIRNILTTIIHELSHHIDYIQRGYVAHDDAFYTIYEKLLKAAISIQAIDSSNILEIDDGSSDRRKIEKRIDGFVPKNVEIKNTGYIIQVSNAYKFKEYLKNRGYLWNNIEYSWDKEVESINLAESEKKEIESVIESKNILIKCSDDYSFRVYVQIQVKIPYRSNDKVKERGYYFDRQLKMWKKRICTTQVEDEKKWLFTNGITDYRINNINTQNKKNLTG